MYNYGIRIPYIISMHRFCGKTFTGARVTLPAEANLASVNMRKSRPFCPSQQNLLML